MTNHAIKRINAILSTLDSESSNAYRELFMQRMNDELVDIDDLLTEHDADLDDYDAINELLTYTNALIAADDRESLTTIALDQSLCPLHIIDYAICFDDQNAECATIRIIHPAHDS